MRLLLKASFALAVLVFALVTVPAAKADTLSISADGFTVNDLGNDGSVPNGLDTLIGHASTRPFTFDGPGSFVATLNDLTLAMGFTGVNSPGSHDFTLSQLVFIDGQAQTMNIFGTIDIGFETHTLHSLNADPLAFAFEAFTVDVRMLPASILGNSGTDFGEFCGLLNAQVTITQNCDPVPEPATLTLLGLGLAGTAARIRQRRKKARLNQA